MAEAAARRRSHQLAVGQTPLGTEFAVVATGLENPRGIEFGPDGRSTLRKGVGRFSIDGGPMPPSCGSGRTVHWRILGAHFSGRRNDGQAHHDRPPSSVKSDCACGRRFRERRRGRYVLERHVVCAHRRRRMSHGLAQTFNSIDRISQRGNASPIVDLSRFLKSHPVENPNPPDFEPDGTWFSFVAVGNAL